MTLSFKKIKLCTVFVPYLILIEQGEMLANNKDLLLLLLIIFT